jgi:hypothetical protein
MKIILTAGEILDKGCWEEFCDKHGINPWAMNEGLMDSDEEFTFTEEEARVLGLLPQKDENCRW